MSAAIPDDSACKCQVPPLPNGGLFSPALQGLTPEVAPRGAEQMPLVRSPGSGALQQPSPDAQHSAASPGQSVQPQPAEAQRQLPAQDATALPPQQSPPQQQQQQEHGEDTQPPPVAVHPAQVCRACE